VSDLRAWAIHISRQALKYGSTCETNASATLGTVGQVTKVVIATMAGTASARPRQSPFPAPVWLVDVIAQVPDAALPRQ
jgi:hypothetical protein